MVQLKLQPVVIGFSTTPARAQGDIGAMEVGAQKLFSNSHPPQKQLVQPLDHPTPTKRQIKTNATHSPNATFLNKCNSCRASWAPTCAVRHKTAWINDHKNVAIDFPQFSFCQRRVRSSYRCQLIFGAYSHRFGLHNVMEIQHGTSQNWN